ncbi:hypothetical protein DEU56DRAFT_896569 [Suillus clintonianus]|uniref:uncharacterized protein n=1 Tax=Suillus clintonianus TaxID=1904413 RepID=UPI001B862D8F|nr:uncharacterized protein DEU56DRAFT_896569 [Suillus clintonianus]KAG2111462.1 hypothetical protein DEU56DRAFT_896569 [Suillus clintonianus]
MASRGIPLDAGALMSTVLEGILYGFSLLMFIGTIWALTYKRRIRDVNRPIAVVAILLLILSTAHMVVNTIRTEDGLVKYRDTFQGGPMAFFGDLTQQTFVIKHALYLLQTLLADGVVIYRCYVVWRSLWMIILPSIMWCTVAVTGVFATYNVSQDRSNSGNIFAKVLAQWITAFFASTIATNLLSSGLLAYRVWMIERNVSTIRTTKGTMMPMVRVLVDSAGLYSVVLSIILICFVCSNNGESVVVDMAMPIMSIAFYMVLIRLAINRNTRSYHSTSPRATTDAMEQERRRQICMAPLQVHISQCTQDDSTLAYKVGNEDQQPSIYKTESV